MNVINPATEEIIRQVKEDDASTLNAKFQQLTAGQKSWQNVPLTDRISVIRKFAKALQDNLEALAATLTSEVGKPMQQSRNEINGACGRINWLADHAVQYLSEEQMASGNGMTETIAYEPLGVIANISAWNYPYLVGVNVFVPALLAGNAVMYKPSEYSTLTGLEIERWLKASGIPDDVFQVAVGGREIGEQLLDMSFDGYFFTGSYKTGKYIFERVSPRMIPCQCELGGKDPLYVADDVMDVAAIAAGTADGAFYNNGQSCCAVERIYVHEKIYDAYVDAFVKEVKSWKIGDPAEAGVYFGALTRPDQLRVLQDQIDEAVRLGATVQTGGKRISRKGYFFEPTVLTNVTHNMKLMREESFGPVIGIMKVSGDAEAIQLMDDTEYGLTAAVYSQSQDRAKAILSKLQTGTGYWNCCDRVSAAVPWSGRRHSGFGATLSHAGLRAFTKPKAYHLRSK